MSFIICDRRKLSDEGDPKDTILFCHPTLSPMDDDTIQLCGHIMGLIEFFSKMSKSSPRLIRRKQSKFAIKVLGPYIMIWGGSQFTQDLIIQQQLDYIYNLLIFYHGSVIRLLQKFSRSQDLQSFCHSALLHFLPFMRQSDHYFRSAWPTIKYLHNEQSNRFIFQKATQLLQSCKLTSHTLAGCVLQKQSVLCNDLPTEICHRLMLLQQRDVHTSKYYKSLVTRNGDRLIDSDGSCKDGEIEDSCQQFVVHLTLQMYSKLTAPHKSNRGNAREQRAGSLISGHRTSSEYESTKSATEFDEVSEVRNSNPSIPGVHSNDLDSTYVNDLDDTKVIDIEHSSADVGSRFVSASSFNNSDSFESVQSDVNVIESDSEKLETHNQNDMAGQSDRIDQSDTAGKSDTAGQNDRAGQSDRADESDVADESDIIAQSDVAAESDIIDQSDRADKNDVADKNGQSDTAGQSDIADKRDVANESVVADQSYISAQSNTTDQSCKVNQSGIASESGSERLNVVSSEDIMNRSGDKDSQITMGLGRAKDIDGESQEVNTDNTLEDVFFDLNTNGQATCDKVQTDEMDQVGTLAESDRPLSIDRSTDRDNVCDDVNHTCSIEADNTETSTETIKCVLETARNSIDLFGNSSPRLPDSKNEGDGMENSTDNNSDGPVWNKDNGNSCSDAKDDSLDSCNHEKQSTVSSRTEEISNHSSRTDEISNSSSGTEEIASSTLKTTANERRKVNLFRSLKRSIVDNPIEVKPEQGDNVKDKDVEVRKHEDIISTTTTRSVPPRKHEKYRATEALELYDAHVPSADELFKRTKAASTTAEVLKHATNNLCKDNDLIRKLSQDLPRSHQILEESGSGTCSGNDIHAQDEGHLVQLVLHVQRCHGVSVMLLMDDDCNQVRGNPRTGKLFTLIDKQISDIHRLAAKLPLKPNTISSHNKYQFLQYDTKSLSLTGNLLRSYAYEDQEFCESAVNLQCEREHVDLHQSTMRGPFGVLFRHSIGSSALYVTQKVSSKASTNTGFPSEKDTDLILRDPYSVL